MIRLGLCCIIHKLMREGKVAYERRGRRKLPVESSVAEYRQRNLVTAKLTPAGSKPSPNTPYQYKHLFS